jgi:hypothetical protein
MLPLTKSMLMRVVDNQVFNGFGSSSAFSETTCIRDFLDYPENISRKPADASLSS